jgi:hypothetical protein
MPKKKAEKRTVTCGKCKETGHNARTCPTSAKAEVKKGPVTSSVTEVPDPPKKKGTKTRIDMRVEEDRERRRQREAPTADTGTAATAAPYRCPKCNAVDILVIVRVKDHSASFKKGTDVFTGEMRCQSCMNKPQPAELILVWGAKPGQKVTPETANA